MKTEAVIKNKSVSQVWAVHDNLKPWNFIKTFKVTTICLKKTIEIKFSKISVGRENAPLLNFLCIKSLIKVISESNWVAIFKVSVRIQWSKAYNPKIKYEPKFNKTFGARY